MELEKSHFVLQPAWTFLKAKVKIINSCLSTFNDSFGGKVFSYLGGGNDWTHINPTVAYIYNSMTTYQGSAISIHVCELPFHGFSKIQFQSDFAFILTSDYIFYYLTSYRELLSIPTLTARRTKLSTKAWSCMKSTQNKQLNSHCKWIFDVNVRLRHWKQNKILAANQLCSVVEKYHLLIYSIKKALTNKRVDYSTAATVSVKDPSSQPGDLPLMSLVSLNYSFKLCVIVTFSLLCPLPRLQKKKVLLSPVLMSLLSKLRHSLRPLQLLLPPAVTLILETNTPSSSARGSRPLSFSSSCLVYTFPLSSFLSLPYSLCVLSFRRWCCGLGPSAVPSRPHRTRTSGLVSETLDAGQQTGISWGLSHYKKNKNKRKKLENHNNAECTSVFW